VRRCAGSGRAWVDGAAVLRCCTCHD
jgi:hypothetical protein